MPRARTSKPRNSWLVGGRGFDGRKCSFGALELIAENKTYAVGEEVRLLVNTDRAGSYVVLFRRCADEVISEPLFLHLEGKSMVVKLPIEQRDVPNRFFEAMTISDGRVYEVMREIAVPPVSRLLNLTVETVAQAKPREKTKVKIKLTDHAGQGRPGSAVLTVYDKSLEYITEGPNVPDIKAAFCPGKVTHTFNPHDEWRSGWCHNLVPGLALPEEQFARPGSSEMHTMEEVAETELADDSAPEFEPFPGRTKWSYQLYGLDEFTPAQIPTSVGPPDKYGRNYFELGAGTLVPMIRREFADTALWVASIDTKEDGTAEVEFEPPDNLTTWKLRCWAMGKGARVGEASTELVTSKDVLVRLQTPRFFIERDEVVISANVHNFLPQPQKMAVKLDLASDHLALTDGVPQEVSVTVAPGAESRVDWRAKVLREGEAKIRVQALGQADADAMELTLPVHVHGMLRTESQSLALRHDQVSGKIEFIVPEQRRPEDTELQVRATPSLASAMVDALPYLADYPYGCTEQTLDRFLPSVITRSVLQDMGLKLADLARRPQQARHPDWDKNLIFQEAKLDDMVHASTERLANMQNKDGGWGWFSGEHEQSYVHTTALVLRGLLVAQRLGVVLRQDMVSRGVIWLEHHQEDELKKLKNASTRKEPWKGAVDNEDALVFSVLAEIGEWQPDMAGYLFDKRKDLSVDSLALLGLAFDRLGKKEQRDMLLRNVEQYLVTDPENQSAHLQLPGNTRRWLWYGNDLETMANYLRLLCKVRPKAAATAAVAKYLVNHRRNGTYWNSTRDTAYCIEALAEYMRASGEATDNAEVSYELLLDGTTRQQVKLSHDSLFDGDNRFVLRGVALGAGKHTLELRKTGDAPLYVNSWLNVFTMEEPIPAAGLEMKVARHYWRLTPKELKVLVANATGNPVEERTPTYDRTEIRDGDVVNSGDLIETELIVESKNDYEYLLIEDLKPAGCEAVDLRSGYVGDALNSYLELRDDRTAFFVRELPLGSHSLKYRLRAETPGVFHALPARVSALYSPELRGNSDEKVVQVQEK